MTDNEKLLREMFEKCTGEYPELTVRWLKHEYYGNKILTIPEGVKKIKDRFTFSFYKDGEQYINLAAEAIILPDGLEEIEGCSFWGLSHVKKFYIPKTVTTIGDTAFRFCSGTIYCENKPKKGWLNKEPEMQLNIYQGGTVYEESIRTYNNWNPERLPVITGVKREDFLKIIDEENRNG